MIKPATPGRLGVEVPADVIDIAHTTQSDRVTAVRIANVPAYVAAKGVRTEVDELGLLTVDVV